MPNYLIFDTTTGKINRQLYVREDDTTTIDLNILSGENYIENSTFVDDLTIYITSPSSPSPAIGTRPLLTSVATWDTTAITADGSDTATLGASLPNPTLINVRVLDAQGAEIIIDESITDGSFGLQSDVIGTYEVVADAFPYQLYVTTITAS